MNSTYSLKQILFALREEYLEVEKRLKELEKYVNITGNIDDISFYIHDFNVQKTIDMYLRKKQTLVDKIREVLGLNGIYTRGVAFWMVPNELEAACYWKRKKVCSITDLDNFTKSINDIIESDFVKNIRLYTPIKKGNFVLDTNAFGVSLLERGINLSRLDYNPKEDIINIEREQRIVTPSYVKDLFNIKFDSESFSDYHKGILDNYEEKEIIIADDFDSDSLELEIIAEPKKLILIPRRTIKKNTNA